MRNATRAERKEPWCVWAYRASQRQRVRLSASPPLLPYQMPPVYSSVHPQHSCHTILRQTLLGAYVPPWETEAFHDFDGQITYNTSWSVWLNSLVRNINTGYVYVLKWYLLSHLECESRKSTLSRRIAWVRVPARPHRSAPAS